MTTPFRLGQSMYMIGIAELAVYGFVKGDFAMTRPPALPEMLQGVNPAMAYITGAMLLASVGAFYFGRYKSVALMIMANLIFWIATIRHLSGLWQDHINGFKSLWLIGGSLLILSTMKEFQRHQRTAIWFNLIVLALFFVDCGIAHLRFAEFVKLLIPEFIPSPMFFTYFAGVCLLLGGIGILIPKLKELTLLLLAIQITGWFFLLHIPRAITISGDEWIGVGESLAVAGICFMLFGMLREKRAVIKEQRPAEAVSQLG